VGLLRRLSHAIAVAFLIIPIVAITSRLQQPPFEQMEAALGAKAVSVVAGDDHLLLRLRSVIACASTCGPAPVPISWLIRIVPALKKPL